MNLFISVSETSSKLGCFRIPSRIPEENSGKNAGKFLNRETLYILGVWEPGKANLPRACGWHCPALVTFARRPLSSLKRTKSSFWTKFMAKHACLVHLEANTREKKTKNTYYFKVCVYFKGVSMPNLPQSGKNAEFVHVHACCLPINNCQWHHHSKIWSEWIATISAAPDVFLLCLRGKWEFKTCSASTITGSLHV